MTKTIAELLQDLDDDTSTLAQTMASNLTTMGVTASASDGLTTLTDKILQIPTSSKYIYTDDCSTDKSSNYTKYNNATITHNNTYYTITGQGANDFIKIGSFEPDIIYETILNATSIGGGFGIAISELNKKWGDNNSYILYGTDTETLFARYYNGFNAITRTNNRLSTNTDYIFRIEYNQGKIYVMIITPNSTLNFASATAINLGNTVDVHVWGTNVKLKDIKIYDL